MGIDAEKKSRIERAYQAAEPRYHELRKKIKPLTTQLLEVLLADNLEEEEIVKRLKALLEIEMELKLHQVRVRGKRRGYNR